MLIIDPGKIRGKSGNVNALFFLMLTFDILQETELWRRDEPAKCDGFDHGRE